MKAYGLLLTVCSPTSNAITTTNVFCGFVGCSMRYSGFLPNGLKTLEKEELKVKYIVHKRFKGQAKCGYVNLPALTECEGHDGYIFYGDKALCLETSENAHQHFAENDDNMGKVRGKFTQSIQKTLSKRDDGNYQARWDKVWSDEISQKYKRTDDEYYWLWNHDFFHADIDDLRHIARLVGAKEDA